MTLAKNIVYNIVKEMTTYSLIKVLSNMDKKSFDSNKVFVIRQLVNTKMKEEACVMDHVNQFNLILSRWVLLDIKFNDEVQALLLLSSFPKSWLEIVTTISSSFGITKLTFEGIWDLILGENFLRKNSKELSCSLLSTKNRGKN